MTPGTRLVDLSLESFAERLAGRTPTPGGGSAAAFLAAAGAGLAAMSFRFTSGEKHAAVEGAMAARVEELDRLRTAALTLVDRDSSAYDAVTAGYKLPKTTEVDRQARAETIEAALLGALLVPLDTMRTALAALELTAQGAPDINRNLASDCAAASWCLWGAVEAAALNVRINAASMRDRELAGRHLVECERVRVQAEALAQSARSAAARHVS